MKEELFVTARSNPLIDPGLHIWTWEVAMYLFLGGLTAGIMVFAAYVTLAQRDREAPFAATQLALLALGPGETLGGRSEAGVVGVEPPGELLFAAEIEQALGLIEAFGRKATGRSGSSWSRGTSPYHRNRSLKRKPWRSSGPPMPRARSRSSAKI